MTCNKHAHCPLRSTRDEPTFLKVDYIRKAKRHRSVVLPFRHLPLCLVCPRNRSCVRQGGRGLGVQ